MLFNFLNVLQHDDGYTVQVRTATSRNGDNKNGDMPKRRHSKTATTRVRTATTISQNGDKHWSKRRQPLVKTVGQNGDSS